MAWPSEQLREKSLRRIMRRLLWFKRAGQGAGPHDALLQHPLRSHSVPKLMSIQATNVLQSAGARPCTLPCTNLPCSVGALPCTCLHPSSPWLPLPGSFTAAPECLAYASPTHNAWWLELHTGPPMLPVLRATTCTMHNGQPALHQSTVRYLRSSTTPPRTSRHAHMTVRRCP